ncbi:pirin family protein [Halomonas urumqiensis]|uniref:Pirin family protein n=1 Tax=Halomonas urumqiensis TaxID=1684789 RepID=A0A2N7UDM1_9GAMM|nr:pirin family protein [Halomonas urumqiensis]PMR78544.1 hypothetical protein C1H70_17535 [Halomonas urumqiensis]PTB03689.1 pirin family protein [Halomonas urumqiensis]GHE20097.1 putative quercetin 2,3-dioxygenase [Halomonas urumqiensis]
MIELRPYSTLGGGHHGWLDSRHHFSFADYFDPDRMHWGQLRVWNDDIIAPHSGFPRHPHRDMEIITYVREGAITHQDTLGNQGRTEAGDVQVMSAGTGIAHSEMNLEDEETRIFQIWIMPESAGLPPTWGSKPFPRGARSGTFVTLASGMGDEEALPIRADARLVAATLNADQQLDYSVAKGRNVYLVPATGRIEVNGVVASARDGVAIADETHISLKALEESEVILVEVSA